MPGKIPLVNRSAQAYIRHTMRRQKINLRGVLEVLLLIEQISGHRLIQPEEAESEVCSQLAGKLLLNPLVEDGGAKAPDLADLQRANCPLPC